MTPIRHVLNPRPLLVRIRRPQNIHDLQHLVLLERHVLLGVQLCFFTFEYWSETRQLRHDTPDGPHVHGLVVVLRAEEELGRAVPDRDDDLVAGGERLEGLVGEPGEPEVPDFDDAGGGDEDVGGLEVAVDDVRVVEVEQAVEELVAEGFEDVRGDGGA